MTDYGPQGAELSPLNESDGTIHAAVIDALRERLDWATENESENARILRAVAWIEEEPDGFWEDFAGPLLDDIEARFR